jgi:hypothetical protein
MSSGSFDARVAKCLAQFRQVETRSAERGQRLQIDRRGPRDTRAADTPDKG